jgi:hypothetical protein
MPKPLRAQARRTAVFLIKHRARAYAKRPMTLEAISPGLAAAAPDTMVAVAKHLIENGKTGAAPLVWIWRGSPNPQRQGRSASRACAAPGHERAGIGGQHRRPPISNPLARAFSSEVNAGSRQENAIKQRS